MIFGAVSVYARTMEDRPICNIQGTVRSVKLKDSIFNTNPLEYLLSINIDSVSGIGGNETGFYTCQSFFKLGEMREVFIVKSDIKVGDMFSIGQKINGVINDVGYNAGSLDGMRLVSYTFETATPQNNQLEREKIETVVTPIVNNGSDQNKILQKTNPNKFLIIVGSIVGFTTLLLYLLFIYKKR